MKVLVCGGLGYIGSHVVRELLTIDSDYEVVVLDNLSTGHLSAFPTVTPTDRCQLERGDIRDRERLRDLFQRHRPDAVMVGCGVHEMNALFNGEYALIERPISHFSASIVVSESCQDPLAYYENNVSGTVSLLQVMQEFHCPFFIFSSTAALFGDPERIPIQSDDPIRPLNPYGESKWMVEQILKWCDSAYGIKSVCLRYFNACGAHASAEIGEAHHPETHLIPLVLQVPLGQRPQLSIYGDDYDTPDGTCIRDYVHVTDLATAHIKALEYLKRERTSNRFNLGNGQGYSVKEIVEAARAITGHPIPVEIRPRRPGDAAILIADSKKAEEVLGWQRKYDDVHAIVRSSWQFHQRHPQGLA